MIGSRPSMLASILGALGATMRPEDATPVRPEDLRVARPRRGETNSRNSKRPRAWHEGRAETILARSDKRGADRAAWFRHLAYGDVRPTTPDPRPRVQARRQAQIDQIIAGRRERDIERRDRNARRQGRA